MQILIRTSNIHISIAGNLIIPSNRTNSIVLFAHGSGSGKSSPRNRIVSELLNKADIATLMLDLLTADEEKEDNQTRKYRFNIPLLSDRLISSVDYLKNLNKDTKDLCVGIFGSSTGAAASLIVAEKRRNFVKALVSRGGRVDMATKYCEFENIRTPSLFIVGHKDQETIKVNKNIFEKLRNIEDGKKRIIIIPGASHLFDEPGKVEQVARLTASWFSTYLKNH